MNSLQINSILQQHPSTRSVYNGCFTENFLPNCHSRGIYVINTESKPRKLGHWVLFVCEPHSVIFFDSFGFHPEFYSHNIANFFNKFNTKHILNTNALQMTTSLLCGAYVIYIAIQLRYKPYNSILKVFKVNKPSYNDRLVKTFLYKLLGNKSSCVHSYCPQITFAERCKGKCHTSP